MLILRFVATIIGCHDDISANSCSGSDGTDDSRKTKSHTSKSQNKTGSEASRRSPISGCRVRAPVVNVNDMAPYLLMVRCPTYWHDSGLKYDLHIGCIFLVTSGMTVGQVKSKGLNRRHIGYRHIARRHL